MQFMQEFGHTPLLIASEQGSLDIVEKLCNKRANVHLTDKVNKALGLYLGGPRQ